jgi:hypothetical protein
MARIRPDSDEEKTEKLRDFINLQAAERKLVGFDIRSAATRSDPTPFALVWQTIETPLMRYFGVNNRMKLGMRECQKLLACFKDEYPALAFTR